MNTWRRLALSVGVAIAIIGPLAAAGGSQPSPPAPRPPVQPLTPLADDGGDETVVQSWALAPAFNDLNQGGNRSSLAYDIAPGGEVRDQVTLFNLSNVELTFRVYATDAFNNQEGAFDLLRGDQKPTEVGTWVTLPVPSITLPAKTQATMPITVKVPVTARPGDHAGAILASNEAQGIGPEGKVIGLDRRTGSRMYIRVAGPLAPQLTVEKIETRYGASLSPLSGSAEVTYRIENRGNVRMGGRQRVSVSGPFGLATRQKVASDIPELLPGQGITMRASFTGVPATAIQVGKVRLETEPAGGGVGGTKSWRARTLAPPYTLLAVALVAWLLTRANRAYVRRRGEAREVEVRAT